MSTATWLQEWQWARTNTSTRSVRTTLGGEGLQHQEGTSHLTSATIPNSRARAYDQAFVGELAIVIDHGMREMLVEHKDVFYYVTKINGNYAQPDFNCKAHAITLACESAVSALPPCTIFR